jgi:hypothetical protein
MSPGCVDDVSKNSRAEHVREVPEYGYLKDRSRYRPVTSGNGRVRNEHEREVDQREHCCATGDRES